MNRLRGSYRNSNFRTLFDLSDDYGRGRAVMLSSAILSSTISLLTGGVFYTSFLMQSGISLVNFGIIGFLPLIANCFSIFAPLILERFEKRKYILVGSRITYFALNILGITLLPYLVTSTSGRVVGFAAIVFVSTLVNALFAGGLTVWHLNFIPDTVRAEFFSLQQILSAAVSSAVLLFSSYIADSLSNTPHQMTILVAIRLVAFFLALVEMALLLRPKEFPYPKKVGKISIKNVFTLPFANKKFLYTIGIVSGWTFASYLTASNLTFHLLDRIGVSYSFLNAIDASYAVFLILLSRWWRVLLRRFSWLKTFAITVFFNVPLMFLYSFVSRDNYLWIIPTVRLLQHVIGVGMNLAYANLPFLNMPKEDQTNYLVFYTIAVNLAGFLGQSLATWFISLTQGLNLSLFGAPYTNVQILIVAQALCQLAIALLIVKKHSKLEPDKV